jgi:aldose sugar dehydrogenase
MFWKTLVRVLLIILFGVIVFWPIKPAEEGAVIEEPGVFDQDSFELAEIARDLYVPWSLVFTASNRMLVSERNGYIRQIVDGNLLPEPVFYFDEVASEGEGGLMGLAVHPEYEQNSYIYAMLSYWQNGDMWIKVERLRDDGTMLVRDTVIIDTVRAAFNHDGGRIHFGPDGKLYISTGDASNGDLSQELTALEGKMLRLNDDGTIPDDNPISDSPIFSLGHRNSQGFDWHPQSGRLYATEHGPSGFDGPPGGDEINHISAGANYGWPGLSHDQQADWAVSPLITFTPAIAPSGARFYQGALFPALQDHLLVAGLRGAGLYELVIDDANRPSISSWRKIPGIEIGRIRDVAIDDKGQIYLLTSNRDGRGTTNEGDDKVYLIRSPR